jgi:hypothetical protein
MLVPFGINISVTSFPVESRIGFDSGRIMSLDALTKVMSQVKFTMDEITQANVLIGARLMGGYLLGYALVKSFGVIQWRIIITYTRRVSRQTASRKGRKTS